MAEYTPTTEEVCRGYHAPDTAMVARGDSESLGEYLSRLSIDAHKAQMFSEAAFGRWLAAHDAEVARRAAERGWDEGQGAGVVAAVNFTPLPPNPYRAEAAGEKAGER